jgi:hypothetical protein
MKRIILLLSLLFATQTMLPAAEEPQPVEIKKIHAPSIERCRAFFQKLELCPKTIIVTIERAIELTKLGNIGREPLLLVIEELQRSIDRPETTRLECSVDKPLVQNAIRLLKQIEVFLRTNTSLMLRIVNPDKCIITYKILTDFLNWISKKLD